MPPKKVQKKHTEAELLKQLTNMDKDLPESEPTTVITTTKKSKKNVEIEVTPPVEEDKEELKIIKRVGRKKTKTQVEPVMITADYNSNTVRSRSAKNIRSEKMTESNVLDKLTSRTAKKDAINKVHAAVEFDIETVKINASKKSIRSKTTESTDQLETKDNSDSDLKYIKKTPKKSTKPPKPTDQLEIEETTELKSVKKTPKKNTKPPKPTESTEPTDKLEVENATELKSVKKTPKKSSKTEEESNKSKPESKSSIFIKKTPKKSSAISDTEEVPLKKIAKKTETKEVASSTSEIEKHDPIIEHTPVTEPKPRGRPKKKVVEEPEPIIASKKAQTNVKTPLSNKNNIDDNKKVGDAYIKPKRTRNTSAARKTNIEENNKENNENENKRPSRLAKVSIEYCKS